MYVSDPGIWPDGRPPAATFCGEDERLSVIAAYGLDELADDPELQQLVRFAAQLCGTQIALISIVEAERQRFLARTGLDVTETPRPTSFCAHAMLLPQAMVVPDATQDTHFADNPLVTGDPHIRFYAGAPLVSTEGAPLGALCVIDRAPREGGLSQLQRDGLSVLADAVKRRLLQRRQDLAALGAIAQREARLRKVLDSVPGIAWSLDGDGAIDYVNARWTEATGAPVPRAVTDWADVIHPDDREASLARWWESFRAGLPHEDEIRMRDRNGEYRWVLSRATPVQEDAGQGNRWFGTVIDVDRAHRLSESRDLLASELSHRIKNIFAVVSGLISLRSRGRPEVKEFADELNGAVRALGTAHDYVRPDDGRGSDCLQGLLRDLLAPYDSGRDSRVSISGDDVEIGARAATPLALIFHELATNAAKYGGLSCAEGRIDIAISTARENEITVEWREIALDCEQREFGDTEGFGSRLLRSAIEGQLGGSLARSYGPNGLEVTITVPVERITH